MKRSVGAARPFDFVQNCEWRLGPACIARMTRVPQPPTMRQTKSLEIPQTDSNPPFRFTRASHAVCTARDLKKTEEFYTEVVGLVASHADQNTLYLRGLEERAHHSLVFERSIENPG